METKKFKSIRNLLRKIKIGLLLIVVMTIFACQQNGKGQSKDNLVLEPNKKIKTDTLKPNVNIKVNKRFDDKGNMIGYDSTYSSVYISGDTIGLTKMKKKLNQSFSSHWFDDPSNYFKNDSAFFKPLDHDWPLDKPMIFRDESVFHRMNRLDSIMDQLFKQTVPRTKEEYKTKTL